MNDELATQLTVRNGTAKVPLPIKDNIKLNDSIIVLLDTTSQTVQDAFDGDPPSVRENIRSYDENANLNWVVEKTPGKSDTYIGISFKNGELWAYAYGGMDYQINPETGKHIGSKVSR